MSLTFVCPACGRSLTVSNDLAGKRGKCAGCGQMITAPGRTHAPRVAARSAPSAERVRELVADLSSLSASTRRQALDALSVVAWDYPDLPGLSDAVPPLLRCLKDASPAIRQGAIWLLGQLGDAPAVPQLIDHLHDRQPEVRREAAHALGRLGDPQAIEPLRLLLHSLSDRPGQEALRETVEEALRKLGGGVWEQGSEGVWGSGAPALRQREGTQP